MRNSIAGHLRVRGLQAAMLMVATVMSAGAARSQVMVRRPARAMPPADIMARLKVYPTQYYVIYTDVEPDVVREAAVRMTCMAYEYQRRTAVFERQVRERLPVFLFSKAEDYHASGGITGSSGIYAGTKLMVIAGRPVGNNIWRVIQHEGFHQYVAKAMSRAMPMWVNEGMAEYFGDGIWTGDSFVTGVIPPARLKQIKSLIKQDQILPFMDMLQMSNAGWNANLAARNYAQAWAMVYFLAHAEDRKYQRALNGFISDIALGGTPWDVSFVRAFGRDVRSFQKRFCDWWASQPENPTADLYNEAVVRTVTSFLARAHGQGQRFADMDEFFKAAADGELKEDPKLWLPRQLLQKQVKTAQKAGKWTLVDPRRLPRIQMIAPEGTTFTGSFKITPGSSVSVEVKTQRETKQGQKERRAPATQPGKSN
jgi:hypothetical protein